MQCLFKYSEWNEMPPVIHQMKDGNVRIARNVTAIQRDGEMVYVGECAVMTAVEYAAYVGAREVAQKREQEIADETILALIEEGSI